MKRGLIILLALSVLSAAALTAATIKVNAARDAVVLEQNVLAGAPNEAGGLSVLSRTHYDSHLLWDTLCLPGEAPEVSTDYRFYDTGHSEDYPVSYGDIALDFGRDHGVLDDEGKILPDEHLSGWGSLYVHVANNTPAGEERSETLRVADFYDFYPLSAYLSLPGFGWEEDGSGSRWSTEYSMSPYERAVAEFFRIPVSEDQTMLVTVEKTSDGRVRSMGISSMDNHYSPWTSCVITGNACYFIVNAMDYDDRPMDFSLVPGGYGIYRLPLPDENHGPDECVGELEMVYPLSPETRYRRLLLDEKRDKLLLWSVEDEETILSVVDVDGMELSRRIVVMDAQDGGVWNYFQGEDYIAAFGDKKLSVVAAESNGDYERVIYADKGGGDFTPAVDHNAVTAWNGERLAVASRAQKIAHDAVEGYYRYDYGRAGFWLAVYDPTGLLYAADYACSLDAGAVYPPCLPWGNEHLLLSWD